MEFLNKETEALLQECIDNSSKFPKVLADKFSGLTNEEDRRLRSRIKTLVDNGYFSKLQWADNVPWFGSITEDGYDYFHRKNEYARRKIIEVYSFDLLDEEIEKILFDTLNKNVVLADITNENVYQAVCKLEEENYITIDKDADVDPWYPYEIVRSWGISITQKGKDYFLEKDRLLREILGNDTGMIEQIPQKKVFEFEKIDSNNKHNETQDIIFNGILGNNCGTYEDYVGSNKKLKQKGFIVKDGIPTLRGFAKISDLASASQAKYAEYQREKNQKHISEIKEFFDHCKAEAKFLPEVVLSVNSSENVILTKHNGNLPVSTSEKIKGILDNMDYYTLLVKPGSLSRVDGNHRLEAGSNSDLYVPFSIILWNVNNNSNEENLLMSSEANNNTEMQKVI